ncbi:MerR family transcriptional regulator [Streptomyces sp. NPDC020096]
MSSHGAFERTYPIGEVAARCGVAVSTLRWWEKRGLLAPDHRESGRRRYTDADLRRIAMVQLLQSTALMSLDEIGVILAGCTRDQDWRTAIRQRIAACDEQITQLTTARVYLTHLTNCPNDHPADNCPYLAREIDERLAERH